MKKKTLVKFYLAVWILYMFFVLFITFPFTEENLHRHEFNIFFNLMFCFWYSGLWYQSKIDLIRENNINERIKYLKEEYLIHENNLNKGNIDYIEYSEKTDFIKKELAKLNNL